MATSTRTLPGKTFDPGALAAGIPGPLWALLGAGFVLRLLFIGAEGFHNDVAAFESWTLTLRDNPPWAFYAKTSFADYPPGYFIVLWLLSKVYAIMPVSGDAAHGWAVLRAFVKMPAIVMDLVNAGVVYAIARRFATPAIALLAAGFLALNPAAIYTSAYWGQVDSVSWGLVLIAVWLLLRAGDDRTKTRPRVVWAWLALAFSLLIKPQAAALAVLLLAYPFATRDAAERMRRLTATGIGAAAAVLFAYAVTLLFHPSGPIEAFRWLLQRYAFGSGVYAYNSVNAFNLHAVKGAFWQPDADPIRVFGLALGPLYVWGIVLVVASLALVTGRYLQRRDDRSLLEAALLCALAFFCLATRMHERYVYGAFLFAMPLVALGRVGLWSAVILTVTTFLNLAYSFAYQTAMEQHTPGIDAANLWPAISHPAALLNVTLFFYLGYRYLGRAVSAEVAGAPTATAPVILGLERIAARARTWFDPREGLVPMTRLDWALAGGITSFAFIIAVIAYWWPNERIFDEIYFARAGEEYLRNITQFEWTHPPFAKEVIAASMALWGGLHGLGNQSYGWRFLNVVIGALECGVLYMFAKRLTGSTLFATAGGLMLALDGFHFSESRIATGEITIAMLALLVLYALYRYLIATQVRVRRIIPAEWGVRFWAAFAAGIAAAAGLAWVANLTPAHRHPEIAAGIALADADRTSYLVAFVYFALGAYLVARWFARRAPATGIELSYADGTVTRPSTRSGQTAKVTYDTPAAKAVFASDGTMTVDGRVVRATDARIWWWVLAGAAALLISSKWSGALTISVAFLAIVGVWAQRFLPGKPLFGNPRGFTLDLVLAGAAFLCATVYVVTYAPFFALGHNLADLLALQNQMWYYHSHLNATHPYSSGWWEWPIEKTPISYYYKDFRVGADAANGAACCVAEILALPNPLVFLLGLVSVPAVAWLAWRERNKGYAVLALAYVMQWLPYARSPRLMFEYHFFPNLAVIVLCDVVLLHRLWVWANERYPSEVVKIRASFAAYGALVVLLFAFFYPVVAGTTMTYNDWYARMWPDQLHIPHTSWILPHR